MILDNKSIFMIISVLWRETLMAERDPSMAEKGQKAGETLMAVMGRGDDKAGQNAKK